MFMHPYCKYSDGTEDVFSDIIINENGEETIQIYFERPTLDGFDSIRFELPSYKILGKYTDEEIDIFKTVVERSAPSFYRWAREGGINIT